LNDNNILATQYAIQKEVKSNPKQPSCKERVRPLQGHNEKRCEIQGRGQEMELMSTNDNSGEFGTKSWRKQHKFTLIVVIKIFAISLPPQPFLGRHLGFLG